jgi:hypothetical protein
MENTPTDCNRTASEGVIGIVDSRRESMLFRPRQWMVIEYVI